MEIPTGDSFINFRTEDIEFEAYSVIIEDDCFASQSGFEDLLHLDVGAKCLEESEIV